MVREVHQSLVCAPPFRVVDDGGARCRVAAPFDARDMGAAVRTVPRVRKRHVMRRVMSSRTTHDACQLVSAGREQPNPGGRAGSAEAGQHGMQGGTTKFAVPPQPKTFGSGLDVLPSPSQRLEWGWTACSGPISGTETRWSACSEPISGAGYGLEHVIRPVAGAETALEHGVGADTATKIERVHGVGPSSGAWMRV